MNFRQKYGGDALRRAQGFLITNGGALGTINSSGARAQLDDVIAQLGAQSTNQEANRVNARGTTSEIGALRNTLRQQNMRPIAQIARAQLATVPHFSALTLPDPKIDTQGLIAAANAMAIAAAPYTSTFTSMGLAGDFIGQLQAAAQAVQTAVDTRAEYHVSGVGATAGVGALLRRGRQAVHMLDGMVATQLVGNDQLLAGWRTAKRVVSKPGVASNGSTPAPAPAPTPVPAPSPVPTSAVSRTPTHTAEA